MDHLYRYTLALFTFLLLPTVTHGQVQDSVVFASEDLVIHRLSPTVYAHVSYLETQDYGRVPCNGMLVVSDGEAALLDTPVNDAATAALLRFLADSLAARVTAVVPTHFHDDCIGGMATVRAQQLPVYVGARTQERLAATGEQIDGATSFTDSLRLTVGGDSVTVGYFGAGHTYDNLVAYSRRGKILFGGCLLKATGAGKGNIADADVVVWPLTVTRVKKHYPNASVVVPGHGQWGGPELYDYTVKLFTPPADR